VIKLATNSVPAVAGSVTNQLRDIKPPVHIPSGWAWLWWVIGTLVCLAIAYAIWDYWKERRLAKPAEPSVAAHILARRRLEEALALISQPKEFCTAVSDTVRWYLEERFDFRAPDRTTEEFLYELQNTNLLGASQKTSLADFLQRCDLVKFARYEPAESELRDLHSSAVRLVDETKPRPVGVPPPIPATASAA